MLMTARFPFLSCVFVLLASCSNAAAGPMVPMEQIGPHPIRVDAKAYAHVIRVVPDDKQPTISRALGAIDDASPSNRYAILVAAGTYQEAGLAMKPYVDLYGGFAPGDWTERDVYQNATILDAQQKGAVVIGADDARLDGFVITGGRVN